MATDPATIHLSNEQKQRLASASDATGVPVEQLLEQSVQLVVGGPLAQGPLANGRTLHDAIAEDGAIGCIHDGPPDVSTNPKYLEGLGADGGGSHSD